MQRTLTYKLVLGAVLAGSTAVLGQVLPGIPEDSAVVPKTATTFINRITGNITTINNGGTESLGVAIANNGNVIVGWEDDGDGLADIEAVWTMFDSAGSSITPNVDQTSIALGGSINGNFMSYFRADHTPVFGGTSWGPKIKANLFGDGVGMGAISYGLSEEVAEFAAWDDANSGDFPSVQLLSNAGAGLKILAGVSSGFATRDASSLRIGDWDYLANGNVVIASENRQSQDLVDVFGGSAPHRHVIYRVLDASGNVVKPETLAGSNPDPAGDQSMWHGLGVTANGFAIRFQDTDGVKVRLFDNTGAPQGDNIDLATVTGHPEAGGGGRGDGAGFHGNGKDAYVAASGGGSVVWATVLNANGTVRWSKTVADDLTGLASVGRLDAAINESGEVIVVFEAKYDSANVDPMIMARRFNAAGTPMGPSFYVSEVELPDPNTPKSSAPRVAWRNGQVAITWISHSDLDTIDPNSGLPMSVVAFRLFSTFTPGSIGSVGLTRIVADTPIVKTDANSLGNWEPNISTLGTSTFLLECNTFAVGDPTTQRFVVGLQPAAGGTYKLAEGFYGDNGQPYDGPINASRPNGNPGRVAGDMRPGAVNYIVGAEVSPHLHPEFQGDNRWNLGFDRLSDGRYGTIQTYSLNLSTLTPTPLSKAIDSANSQVTSGAAQGNQISRFGGDVVALDNGNFVSVVEDRSGVRDAANTVVATIFAPNGSIVKSAFGVVTNSDIWCNLAVFKGGFAVRAKPADGSNTRVLYFYDNSGTLKGVVDQATSGVSFDTGRGDGTRIFGHINSPYVYLAGRAANTSIVKVAAFDSRTRQFVAVADVNEGSFTGNFDRVNGAVDALNRMVVSWVSQPSGYAKQQVAARVLSFNGTSITPLTRSFFPFVNVATNDIRSLQMSVAMTTKQICVAAKGEINYSNKPELGPDSPTEVNFFTVFTHPNPQDDPTAPVGGPAPTLTIARSGANLAISWDASATGYTLKSKNSLSDATWTTVGTQNPTTVTPGTGAKFYRLEK